MDPSKCFNEYLLLTKKGIESECDSLRKFYTTDTSSAQGLCKHSLSQYSGVFFATRQGFFFSSLNYLWTHSISVVCIYPTHLRWAWCDTILIFEQSKACLNSEIPFSYTIFLVKIKGPNPAYCLTIAGRKQYCSDLPERQEREVKHK